MTNQEIFKKRTLWSSDKIMKVDEVLNENRNLKSCSLKFFIKMLTK